MTDPELGLRGGVARRWGALGLQLDVAAWLVSLDDKPEGGRSWFLSFVAGAGLLYHRGALWLGPRVAIGPSLLLGASEQSFVFAAGPGMWLAEFEGGVFPGLLLRSELAGGWRLASGVTLLVVPLAVDWAPLPARDSAEGFRVLRFHFALGVGWQR